MKVYLSKKELHGNEALAALWCLQQQRVPQDACRKMLGVRVAQCSEIHRINVGSRGFMFSLAGLKRHWKYQKPGESFGVSLPCAFGRTLTTIQIKPFPVRRQTRLLGACVRLSHGNRERENTVIK